MANSIELCVPCVQQYLKTKILELSCHVKRLDHKADEKIRCRLATWICKPCVWYRTQCLKYTKNSTFNKKTSNLILLCVKDLNRDFSKEDIQVTKKLLKRCPTPGPLGRGKLKQGTPVYQLGWLQFTTLTRTHSGKNVEKEECSFIKIAKWYSLSGRQPGAVSHKAKHSLTEIAPFRCLNKRIENLSLKSTQKPATESL